MVERAERLGVAIQTAYRLYEGGSDAELRSALVLLDSAAELLLYAGAREATKWFLIYERHAEMAKRKGETVEVVSLPSTVTFQDLKGKAWVLSNRAKEKIEREFGKKLELLEFHGDIPASYRIALTSLHEYRNAAYHRDSLRIETLRTSVELHFYLTAQLLRALIPGSYRLPHREEVERIAALLGLPEALVLGGQPTLQNALADYILDRLHLEEQGVQEVLADNILARVETIEDELDFALEVAPTSPMDRADIIRMVQEIDPMRNWEAMRKKQYPVTQKVIDFWRTEAETVRTTEVPLNAFNVYANIEERMGKFEQEAERMAIAADEYLQHQIDVARGK